MIVTWPYFIIAITLGSVLFLNLWLGVLTRYVHRRLWYVMSWWGLGTDWVGHFLPILVLPDALAYIRGICTAQY